MQLQLPPTLDLAFTGVRAAALQIAISRWFIDLTAGPRLVTAPSRNFESRVAILMR